MSFENHIIKVSFCGTFQKAVKLKRPKVRSYYNFLSNDNLIIVPCDVIFF